MYVYFIFGLIGLVYGLNEKVRVELSTFKGKQYLGFRILFKDETDDSWKYTKKGITISTDLLDDLKKAIDKAASQVYEDLPGA